MQRTVIRQRGKNRVAVSPGELFRPHMTPPQTPLNEDSLNSFRVIAVGIDQTNYFGRETDEPSDHADMKS